MDTTPTGQQHLTLLDRPDTTSLPLWRRAVAAITNGTNRALRFLREDGLLTATALAALAVLAVVAGLLWLLWTILTGIIAALGAGAGAAGSGITRLAGWLAHGPITHAINDPVRAFLDTHTVGLPATGHDLWIVWLVTAGVLYLTGLAGSRYARIGWAAIGALTAAAAYSGAAGRTGPAAAGATAAVWLLLSLPVYARAKRVSVLEQIAFDLQQRRQARTARAELDLSLAEAAHRSAPAARTKA